MSAGWAGGSDRRWRALRAQVLARDSELCQVRSLGCTGHATQVDHIVPLSVDTSGKYDPDNLRATCAACNQRRNRKGRPFTRVQA